MRHTLTLALTIAAAISPAAAHAQTTTTNPPDGYQQVVSSNPLGLLANWFNAEYERTIGQATTVGVAASVWNEADCRGASVLLRWYPQRDALAGFYMGARAGACHVDTYRRDGVRPGVGIEVGHNWLFGPRRNVSVGIGAGLTRLLSDDADSYGPVIIPNVRLVNLGIAF